MPQRIEDGVLDEVLGIESSARRGRETAACPPAQRRQASLKKLIERVAVAATHPVEKLDRRLEGLRSTWFHKRRSALRLAERRSLRAGLMILVPGTHRGNRIMPFDRGAGDKAVHHTRQRFVMPNRTFTGSFCTHKNGDPAVTKAESASCARD